MLAFLLSLLPKVQHLGTLGYWLVLLISCAESVPVAGAFVPGATVVMLAGFLSAHGYLEPGDLVWFAAAGGILGDALGYWLGTKGMRFFKNENKYLTRAHLEKGTKYFETHGSASVFWSRFIALLRPVVPFVAGLSNMKLRSFMMWNIASAFVWAAVFVGTGYLVGDSVAAVLNRGARIGIIIGLAAPAALVAAVLYARTKHRTP